MEYKTKIPVAIVVFNRLDCVQENIKAIRVAAPPRLYVISDGPRDNVPGEDEKVNAVRKYIEDNVDWDCELIKIYSDKNMGCDKRSASGYNEVFAHEEMAILIEDDAIAARSFFPYCEKMLEYYKDDPRVFMVAGQNRMPDYVTDKDYLFSVSPSKYVWGTWKRAWDMYDKTAAGDFDYDPGWLKKTLTRRVRWFFDAKMLRCLMALSDTWDAIWDCTMLANSSVGIVPVNNLVTYIGANREDATHMFGDAEIVHLPVVDYDHEPDIREGEVKQDREYDLLQQEHMIQGKAGFYIRSKIAYYVWHHFPVLYKKLSGFF